MNLYAYVGNDPLTYVDPDGQVRIGISGTLKIAAFMGVRVTIGVNFDTKTLEVGGDMTVGGRVGAQLAARVEAYVEPSSEKGNEAEIKVNGVAEVQAELNLGVASVGGCIEATAGGECSSAEGCSASAGIDASGSLIRGPVDVDPETGRATISFGGGIGASAGADVTVTGN